MEYGLVVIWWVVFVGLGVLGYPISAALFRSFPDRGAGFALPVALLVVFLTVYWVGRVSYGPYSVLIGLGVLVAGSYASWSRGVTVRRAAVKDVIVVFTVAFLVVIAIRSVDPSIQPAGGEKFLDYGLLNTVLRSSQLPPQDMWFAGEPVQYYYGGYLLSGILAILTQTPGQYAYNLALAGFYGLLVTGAYSLAGAVIQEHNRSVRNAGLLAAFFVGGASNLVPVLQAILWVLPDPVAIWTANRVSAVTALDVSSLLVFDNGLGFLYYWRPSRVIPGTINEFPLFAWLNGDLQAHMMSTPFFVLAGAIALAYYHTPNSSVTRRRVLVFGVLPPVIGSLLLINTWDFPSSLGLVGVTVLFAAARPRGLLPGTAERSHSRESKWWWEEVTRFVTTGVVTALVGLLGLVWVLPFVLGPLTGAGTWRIDIVPEPSGLLSLILVHGWMIAVFGVFLWSRFRKVPLDRRRGFLVAMGIGLSAIMLGVYAILLVLPLIIGSWVLLRTDDQVGFEGVLLVTGACIVLIVEFVFINEQAGPGRWNTVFKSYMHVWIVWAIGAGIAVSKLSSFPERRRPWPIHRDAWLRLGVVVLIVSVSLYAAIALGAHFSVPADPTLDATTWASQTHPDELAAIGWLARQSGQPHIVSTPGCGCHPIERVHPYRWVNAPSTFTGIPTVAGWSHQIGYRGVAPYSARVDDVRTIYTGSPAEQRSLLAKYDVRYIWVSENERALYGDVSFGTIDAVQIAYQNDAVTIYEVDLNRLSDPA